MSINVKAVVDDWQIVAVHGGGVCVLGVVGGRKYQTSNLTRCHAENGRKFVATQNGSIYELGAQKVSMWWLGLQFKRPQECANLLAGGII